MIHPSPVISGAEPDFDQNHLKSKKLYIYIYFNFFFPSRKLAAKNKAGGVRRDGLSFY